MLRPSLNEMSAAYVVFPDYGAHRRFFTMVHHYLPGIPLCNILWISKSRVGAEVKQVSTY